MSTTIEFGTAEDGSRLTFDPANLHTVVCGRTRAGKSSTTYSIAGSAAKIPWVRLAGIDPSGILLGPACGTERHSDFALGTSPAALEHAIDVLQGLERLMDDRIAKLMRLGIDQMPPHIYQDPRVGVILVLLEEYAGCIAAMQPKQGAETRRVLGRILREGSKVKIHCYTILQRPEAAILHDRAQYARSILHAVENADSIRMVFPQSTPEEQKRVLDAPAGRGYLLEAARPNRYARMDLTEYHEYAAVMRKYEATKKPLLLWQEAEK